MKIEVPVPSLMKLRINRSRTDRTEEFKACTTEAFELAEHSSVDVHLVAEWRQAWAKIARDPSIVPAQQDGWSEAFAADPELMRLVMIDGAYYSPLKCTIRGSVPEFLRTENLSQVMAEAYDVYDYSGQNMNGFWYGIYKKLVGESGFVRHAGDVGQPVLPDMKGKTLVEESAGKVREGIISRLATMASIDGMVWARVNEPMLVLNFHDEQASIRVAEVGTLMTAPDRAVAFSISDYGNAVEFVEANFPERVLKRQIDEPQVFAPKAFGTDIERDELLRCVEYMVEYAAQHLKILPQKAGNAWYVLRDLHEEFGENPDGTALDNMSAAARDFAIEMSAGSFKEKLLKDLGPTGMMLTERWALRPVQTKLGLG